MSRLFHDVGMYRKALTCAKEAYLYRKSMFDTSNALALADAYCDVDSTLQAKDILAKVSKDSHASRHLIYYIRCKAAIREGQIQPAIVCLDSSNYYLDKMYCTTMQVKNDYYPKFDTQYFFSSIFMASTVANKLIFNKRILRF